MIETEKPCVDLQSRIKFRDGKQRGHGLAGEVVWYAINSSSMRCSAGFHLATPWTH